MQTFLPNPSFAVSAAMLDDRRLANQRNEAFVILRTLLGELNGWRNHPAVRMWRGCEGLLWDYGAECCIEWHHRGHPEERVGIKYIRLTNRSGPASLFEDVMPTWLGNEAFHASHRAALLAKDPEWYGQFGWTEEPKVDYVWPG